MIAAFAASTLLCAGMGPARAAAAQDQIVPVTSSSGSAPSSSAYHGMSEIAPHVYVDRDMPAENTRWLLNIVDKARVRTAYFYGELVATPDILFCATIECYRRFGGIGLGYAIGNQIIISPYGGRAAIVSHELSHVELAARLDWRQDLIDRVPQWFDEGTAVMVSLAYEFSDEAWLKANHGGASSPSLSELESREDWNRITGTNGCDMHRSYGTARREVARWYAKVGSRGLNQLIETLKTDQEFHAAYQGIESTSGLILAARN